MIIKSVDELKVLVDEFSDFARMPAAQPTPNSLNEVIGGGRHPLPGVASSG